MEPFWNLPNHQHWSLSLNYTINRAPIWSDIFGHLEAAAGKQLRPALQLAISSTGKQLAPGFGHQLHRKNLSIVQPAPRQPTSSAFETAALPLPGQHRTPSSAGIQLGPALGPLCRKTAWTSIWVPSSTGNSCNFIKPPSPLENSSAPALGHQYQDS